MLFEIIMNEDNSNIPDLPEYIQDGLQFIKDKLKGEVNGI